jgi:hypothetical protein
VSMRKSSDRRWPGEARALRPRPLPHMFVFVLSAGCGLAGLPSNMLAWESRRFLALQRGGTGDGEGG